jgi:hypothetical protein
MNVAEIPLAQLLTDLRESQNDITVCEMALTAGITVYGAGQHSVQYRLDANRRIVSVINAELTRRASGEALP